ncbi:YrhK family protein [Planomicrobium okeanokoites]|uniref:YrhK family protein n=1 Tax=Planomicrobium okeanokoites TaxID=244 RepID=UPI0024929934|nr:YrhK family protein [Planomicrobium okeanokoites]
MPSMKDRGDYLEITTGVSRVIFTKQCKLTRTINDLLVGIFFVFGSLFNFLGAAEFYGNVLYLLGSSILAARAVYSIRENIRVEHEVKQQSFDEPGVEVEGANWD